MKTKSYTISLVSDTDVEISWFLCFKIEFKIELKFLTNNFLLFSAS